MITPSMFGVAFRFCMSCCNYFSVKKLTFDLGCIKMLKFFCQKKKKRSNLLLNHRKPTIKQSKSIKSFVVTRFKHLKVTQNTQKMLNNELKIFSLYQLTMYMIINIMSVNIYCIYFFYFGIYYNIQCIYILTSMVFLSNWEGV